MLTSLGAIVVLAVAAVYLQQRIGERAAIRTARESAALISRGIVEPVLTERMLAGTDRAALDRIIRTRVLDGTNVRVKIWSPDGTILYSDEPRLIGQRFPLERDETEVLATGGTAAGISDLSAPENRLETDRDRRLLEVYRPVHVAPTGRVVLFEVYKRFDEASVSTLRVWRTSALALLGAVALIWLLQVPLACRSRGGCARATRSGSGCCNAPWTHRTSSAGGSPRTSTTASCRSSPAPPTRWRRRRAPPAAHRPRRPRARWTRAQARCVTRSSSCAR